MSKDLKKLSRNDSSNSLKPRGDDENGLMIRNIKLVRATLEMPESMDTLDMSDLSKEEQEGMDEWESEGMESLPFVRFDQEGSFFDGVLVHVLHGVGKHESTVFRFDVGEGKRVNMWGSTVLDRKITADMIGKRLRIIYRGIEGDNDYKSFRVMIHRPKAIPPPPPVHPRAA